MLALRLLVECHVDSSIVGFGFLALGRLPAPPSVTCWRVQGGLLNRTLSRSGAGVNFLTYDTLEGWHCSAIKQSFRIEVEDDTTVGYYML